MSPLSAALQAQAQQVVQRFQEVHGADCAFSEQEQWVLASSDFVSDALLAQPAWLATLREQPPAPGEWQHYAAWLQDELEEVRDEAQLMRTLRLFRRETLVRIAWGAGSGAVFDRRNAAAAERIGGNADRQRARLAVPNLLP